CHRACGDTTGEPGSRTRDESVDEGDGGALLIARRLRRNRSEPGRSLSERPAQLVIGSRYRELRAVSYYVVGRSEQNPPIRRGENRRIVVRVTRGNLPKRMPVQGLDGLPLAVLLAQAIAGDSHRGIDLERVAEERRPAELADQRLGELIEGIGK